MSRDDVQLDTVWTIVRDIAELMKLGLLVVVAAICDMWWTARYGTLIPFRRGLKISLVRLGWTHKRGEPTRVLKVYQTRALSRIDGRVFTKLGYEVSYRDEGVTWCRGWGAREVRALKASAVL